MDFFSANHQKRPVRLSNQTRNFAYESLNHKYGKYTQACYSVTFDGDKNYEKANDIDKYDMAVRKIAEEAPIRICDGEKLSGAATLGAAIYHGVPASVDGVCTFSSISHLTTDFSKVLKKGWNGIRLEVKDSMKEHSDPYEIRFLESCLSCIDSLDIWRKRYISSLEQKGGFEKNIVNLKKVPFQPAETFYEAVQSLWFTFAFLRLCGNWPGFGRFDVMLGDYLRADLEKGTLTIDDAREILAHFFIKGCEWITGDPSISGDAQHYQNIVLSGIDETGRDVTNEVTYLVLDIIEETGIGDFPTTFRINKRTDAKLLRRIAEVISYGGGIIAVYNEDTVIKAMTDYGYPYEEAVHFANDGCWEMQIPGKTNFSYVPFDSLKILQSVTLDSYSGDVIFNSYKDLYEKYIYDLKCQIDTIVENYDFNFIKNNGDPTKWTYSKHFPCTVVSLLEDDCIKRAKSYLDGGCRYNVISPHIGGIADTVNALYAIKKIVFEEKKVTFSEFMTILKNNWKNNEFLRRYILSKYKFYGNDNDEVDDIYISLTDDFSKICLATNGRSPIKYPAGVSTFGRQIEWAPSRLASPHARYSEEVLSGNTSPTPGTDIEGATAVIKSYCKADLSKMVTGTALDIHLLPSSVEGENGITAIVSLIKGFILLGGSFMQIDVANVEILKDAKIHPENYSTLSVRVSGWNARFVTLSEEWQDMIIERYSS